MVNHGGKIPKRLTCSRRLGHRSLLPGAVCAVLLAPLAVPSSDAVRPVADDPVRLVRQCQQRVGPFVTQSTAYQRLRQAQSQGYGVSGVFPCYGEEGRGYCFNVFYQC